MGRLFCFLDQSQRLVRLQNRECRAAAAPCDLCLVRRPYGLHAIPAIIQTHASHKARRPIACEP
jgi:hypothetical protein